MTQTTATLKVDDKTVEMPVKAGTIGPSVVDIGKLYAQTASNAGLSAAGLPVRRCTNRSANPVHPSTSLRTSVIRARGNIPFNRRARSRAASGTAGGVRGM